MALFDLSKKTIVVTGAAHGIGLFYSQQLAALRASVVLADIDSKRAIAEAQNLNKAGHSALGVHVDVQDEESTRNMASTGADSFGRIDSLVNNAALMHSIPRRSWEEISADEWDRVMAVNCRGPFPAILIMAVSLGSTVRRGGPGSPRGESPRTILPPPIVKFDNIALRSYGRGCCE